MQADPAPHAFGPGQNAEVVEIGLLVPGSWADALVEISRRRGQSVAQILRRWIDHEIRAELGTRG